MRVKGREKMIAAVVSLAIHLALFMALAISGFFLFLHQHEESMPVDVTLYEESKAVGQNMGESLNQTIGGNDSESVAISTTSLPHISEAYTQDVEKKREIKQVAAETGVSLEEAAHIVGSNGQANSQGSSPQGETSSNTGNGQSGMSKQGDGGSNGHQNGHSAEAEESADRQEPVQLAQVLYKAAPDYPADLRSRGVEGATTVHLIVSPDGSVSQVGIIGSSGYGAFDDAARQAVYQYHFSPALNAYGQPVSCGLTTTIHFRLK